MGGQEGSIAHSVVWEVGFDFMDAFVVVVKCAISQSGSNCLAMVGMDGRRKGVW